MNAKFAAESHATGPRGLAAHDRRIVEACGHPVHGRHELGHPRNEHELRARMQQLLLHDVEIELVIERSEHQALDTWRTCDVERIPQSAARLDERQHGDSISGHVADAGDHRHIFGLGQHDRLHAIAHAQTEIVLEPWRAGAIDAYRDAMLAGEPRRDGRACIVLAVQRYGVLEVDDHPVSAGRKRFFEALGTIPRHEKIGAWNARGRERLHACTCDELATGPSRALALASSGPIRSTSVNAKARRAISRISSAVAACACWARRKALSTISSRVRVFPGSPFGLSARA